MISQVYISPTLEATFGENFRNFWKLKKYSNPTSPAIFFGLYTQADLDVLTVHKSNSIIIWGGGDMRHDSLSYVYNITTNGNGFTLAYPGEFSKILKDYSIPHKLLYLQIKNYSEFASCPLGDKIYVYRGIKGTRSNYFQWDNVITPLIKYFGENKIIYTDNLLIPELMENFYKKSFVYVKPTPKGGCTAMFELGHMGRKTIGIGHSDLPNFIKYKSIPHLIKLIEHESKYIGSIQTNISEETRNIFCGREWLDLNFWKK